MGNEPHILKEAWNNNYIRFIVGFLGLYLLLYFFNLFYIAITAPGGMYIKFLDDHLNYIRWWRSFSLESTASIIKSLGYKVRTNATQLAVYKRSGFTLVYECLGYGIMSAFIAFVATFPKPFKHRLIFMLSGLIFIQALNILRFVLLSLYWSHQNLILGLDHHGFFNSCIYLLLILICYIWINRSIKHGTNHT